MACSCGGVESSPIILSGPEIGVFAVPGSAPAAVVARDKKARVVGKREGLGPREFVLITSFANLLSTRNPSSFQQLYYVQQRTFPSSFCRAKRMERDKEGRMALVVLLVLLVVVPPMLSNSDRRQPQAHATCLSFSFPVSSCTCYYYSLQLYDSTSIYSTYSVHTTVHFARRFGPTTSSIPPSSV